MLPELIHPGSLIRVSPEIDIPVTDRVLRIIDTPAFRRLARISQLGLVALVYPGATHTRFEHSLGVYRNALEFLRAVQTNSKSLCNIEDHQAKVFLVAALLHDIGHWPFCHAIEDMRLPHFPRHEILANALLQQGELASVLKEDWQVDPTEVAQFLHPEDKSKLSASDSILRSMLSGPIDIDKLDYLERDSLHAGVPYGRNFDRHRLVQSLCVDDAQHRLAITEKAKTAAEMMVFARYVMFSEVYWHHAVRSATAMLQRAVYELRDLTELANAWMSMDEADMRESICTHSFGKPWEKCVLGIFGQRRSLYKRIAQFDCLTHPTLHGALARRSFPEIVAISTELSRALAHRFQVQIAPCDVLIDAPPTKLEVQFNINIRLHDGSFRALGELSPVVQSLALKQFDDLVKRVRIFIAPDLRASIEPSVVPDCLQSVLNKLGLLQS